MSFRSSLQNSFKRSYPQSNCNKENQIPNFPTREGNTPQYHKKIHPFSEIPSAIIQSIGAGTNSQTTEQSLRTMMKQFQSENSDSEKNLKIQSQKFIKLLCLYSERTTLNLKEAIQLCENQHIFSVEEVKNRLQGKNQDEQLQQEPQNIKEMLQTDLGILKVQYLCECLRSNDSITLQQENILSYLIQSLDQNQEISEAMVWQAFHNIKQQQLAQQVEVQELKSAFETICRNKIWPKLRKKELQVQLSKNINKKTFRDQISYSFLSKILDNSFNLATADINTIFKYLYSIENKAFMFLIDPKKTIKTSLVMTNLLKLQKFNQQHYCNSQFQHKQYLLQDSYKQIQQLNKDKYHLLEIIKNKDDEIEKLQKKVELLQFQALANSGINNKKFILEKDNYHKKYHEKIQSLQQKVDEQKKLTRWYQRQLEALVKSINKQSLMRKYLVHDHFEDISEFNDI